MKSPVIRTLKQAEAWCKEHNGAMEFRQIHGLGCSWGGRWTASCWPISRRNPLVIKAPTPWAAVEKLRKKVEGK